MRLNSASHYAVIALAHMARQPDATHTVQAIVRERAIPLRFLPKLLLPLVHCGILRSKKGPGGGFRLARPPRQVSLLEVFEAIEGPLGRRFPAGGEEAAIDRAFRAAHDRAAEAARRVFARVSLAELAERR